MAKDTKDKKKKTKISSILGAIVKPDPFTPPHNPCRMSSQDGVPIYAVHEKYGLIETYPGFFTKGYFIKENNYQIETEEVEVSMFSKFRAVLNSVGVNCEIGFSIHNHNIDFADFQERVLKKEAGDNLDFLRRELNKVTADRVRDGNNGIEKKKYLTFGIHTDSVKKAAAEFIRFDRELKDGFAKIQSGAEPIPLPKRLEIIHDIYKPDQAGEFLTRSQEIVDSANGEIVVDRDIFDFDNLRGMGLRVPDVVGPTSAQFSKTYVRIGRRYVRVMRVTQLPSGLPDSFFVNLTNVDFPMISTVNIRPIPAKEASAWVHKSLVLAQTERSDEVKSLVSAGLPQEMVSPEADEKVERAKELRSDMVNNDEKLFAVTYTLMFWADSLEELQAHTQTIHATCQSATITCSIMEDLQEIGFNTTLPLLNVEIPMDDRRTLKSTSAAAVCMPFSNLELSDPDGINYSQHLISRNLIMYDRLKTQNFNGFILGTPGCFTGDTEIAIFNGKSFSGYTTMTLKEMAESEKTDFGIIAYDVEAGEFKEAKGRHARVVKQVNQLAIVRLSNGEIIKCTVDHEWLSKEGKYIQAKDLRMGEPLCSLDSKVYVRNVRIEDLTVPVDVYDLEENNADNTQDYENYMLGCGVIVHNSGKSFTAKVEMLNVILGSNADCIVIDPEAEYLALAKLIGGEVVKIEPGGKWHINPMEINSDYVYDIDEETTETNPILAKADFIMSLMEVIVKTPFGLNSIQETIIDECVRKLYQPFIDSEGRLRKIPAEKMPTLTDLQIAFAQRKEPEAYELAMALKLYTGDGSLNVFGFQSNVDVRNRFVVYNIKDVGDKLKSAAMFIILDSIMNRLFENRRLGKNTFFWVDEIYLCFQDPRSAMFLNMLWKRARKYGGVPTGITQNVEDLLESDVARKMLSNCNFIEILRQAPADRDKLAIDLSLSQAQLDVITSAPAGQGLIYTGDACVPFASTFPKYKEDGTVHPIYRVLTSSMKEIKAFEEGERRRQFATKKAEKKKELA